MINHTFVVQYSCSTCGRQSHVIVESGHVGAIGLLNAILNDADRKVSGDLIPLLTRERACDCDCVANRDHREINSHLTARHLPVAGVARLEHVAMVSQRLASAAFIAAAAEGVKKYDTLPEVQY